MLKINPKGMGKFSMIQDQIAEVKISYTSKIKYADRIKVVTSTEVIKALRLFWPSYEHVEFAYVVLLNRHNQILGFHQLSKGGLNGTVIDLRVIFQVALKANANSVILVHNHPSGNLEPSEADKQITQKVKEAGKVLEIPLLDHIILTAEGHLSFADEGYL